MKKEAYLDKSIGRESKRVHLCFEYSNENKPPMMDFLQLEILAFHVVKDRTVIQASLAQPLLCGWVLD